MRALAAAVVIGIGLLSGGVVAVPGTGETFETLKQIDDLQMKKKIAIHAEDYDLAKKFKLQIQKLEKSLEPPPPPRPPPPPPPTPLSELSTEERHAKRVEAVRNGIINSRDKDHDGDTHKFFAHVDADESGHLSHDELYHLLGVPKGEPVSVQREKPELAGTFKMMDGLVEGMKVSMDADDDGTVTKAEFHALLHGTEL